MGEYYSFINLDRKEYVNPFIFDDSCGGKFLECLWSDFSKSLCFLLRKDGTVVGRWYRDRVIFLGDSVEDFDLNGYKDISKEVIKEMQEYGFAKSKDEANAFSISSDPELMYNAAVILINKLKEYEKDGLDVPGELIGLEREVLKIGKFYDK